MGGGHAADEWIEDPARVGAVRFASAASLSLGRAFRATRLVLADRRAEAPTALRVHFVNWPDWCLPYYCRHVLRRDPIRGWLDATARRGEGGVARLSDLVPALRAGPSAFPDPRLGACGAGYVLTIALRDQGRVVGALSLVRAAGEGDFSDADCALAHAMAPVLELAWRGAHAAIGGGAIVDGRSVHAGAARAGPSSAGLACEATPLEALTPREREVAALVAAGHSNKSIARLLDASPWTVKNHLRAVFRKTGVGNRTALCALTHAAGWRAPEAPASPGQACLARPCPRRTRQPKR